MRATLDHVTIHDPTISSYFFKPEGRFRFVAGEYTELYVPHSMPDNRGESRKFTIASAPHEPLIEILTTFAKPNQQSSTFKQALRNLQPGDSVQISETTGDFVLPKDPAIRVHFIVAGVGISPVLSIVQHLVHAQERRFITVIHGLSDRATYLDAPLLQHYCQIYSPILKHADTNWSGATGSLSAEHILKIAQPKVDDLLYIAGPESLVTSLRADLVKHGTASAQIVVDLFTGY